MVHFKGKRYSCSCPNGTCDMNCRMYRIAAGKPSNADRIRAMTDEELAEWIANEIWKAFAQGAGNPFFNQEEAVKLENQEWLDWLKQEVKE